MASANFNRALTLTLGFEGGYSDHPLDPGGATNLGITQATLSRHRGKPVSKSEVMALRRDEAADIYRKSYWNAVRGDDLPSGVDLVLFDFGVNSGPARAVKALQASLRLKQDGAMSDETLAAAAKREPGPLIRDLSARRLGFLQKLSSFGTFGRGWSRRVAGIEAAALQLASAAPVQQSGLKEKTMDETKSLFSSRTVWANIIGLVALLLSHFGLDASELDQAKLLDALCQTIAAGSFIASSVFRVFAKKAIT